MYNIHRNINKRLSIMKYQINKWEEKALIRTLKIQNSHPFIKQEDKTQIITTKHKKKDIYRTRQTHVQETSIISQIIAKNIGFKYTQQLINISLLHDIGHAPDGHEGGSLLNSKMIENGLEEGFSDNNANFEVILNNNIELSDYELASIVKREDKLYDYQKEYLLPKIKKALDYERKEWGKNKKRTMASLIMDLADEISYAFSDFIDGYTLGYTEFTSFEFINSLILKSKNKKTTKLLKKIKYEIVAKKSKKELRDLISKLRILFIQSVYFDKKLGVLRMIDNKEDLLKDIIEFNFFKFIKHPKLLKERNEILVYLEKYINFILKNEYFPSDSYKEKYLKAKTKKEKLRIMRNMIGDTTDSYVINFVQTNIEIY